METHVIYFKNDKGENFKVDIFETKDLDNFLDELNKAKVEFIEPDGIDFVDDIFVLPLTDDAGAIIGTLTHER